MNRPIRTPGWIHDSGPAWRPVRLLDLSGDGRADILWFNPYNSSYAIWPMNDTRVIDAQGFGLMPGWIIP